MIKYSQFSKWKTIIVRSFFELAEEWRLQVRSKLYFSNSSYWILGPIVFSIIFLSIRAPQIEQQEHTYSATYQLNTNCRSKNTSNVTLYFKAKSGTDIRCSSIFKENLTCQNLTYGMINHYPKIKFTIFVCRCLLYH